MDYAALLDDTSHGHSLIVSNAFFDADARSLELVMMVVCALAAAWAIAAFVVMAIGAIIENAGRPRALRAKVARLSPFIPRFTQRRNALLQQVRTVTEHAQSLQKTRATLKSKHNVLLNASDYMVRQIGENVIGSQCYKFIVSNRYVLNYATKGQKHPTLDDSWKRGQIVEVWAESLLEARVAVAERYSASLGFSVSGSGSTGEVAAATPMPPDPKR